MQTRRISQVSGTNRNSFYYHYETLEDLARKAFMRNAAVAKPLIMSLITRFRFGVDEGFQPDENLADHAKRVMLCARSESPFLRHLVNEMLREIWFDELGIDENLLTIDEKTEVDFIFGGLVNVLGSNAAAESPLLLTRLAASRVGQTSLTILQDMAEEQRTSRSKAQ